MASHKKFEFAGLSDVGVKRSHNQDSYAILPATDDVQWLTRGYIFLGADGMGAHAGGELASKLAADSIPHIYSKHAIHGPIPALRRAFLEGNATIHNRGQQNREFEGMGTTSTAMVIRPEGVWVGHVGDSRVYRIREGKVEQISFDHSLVWEMAKRQKCSPEELTGIPSNVIVRSLGPEAFVEVDIEGPYPVKPGDIYLVCSDGLTGPVTDREIGAVASVLPPAEACQLLVDLANLHGGPDNITLIITRVGKFESEEVPENKAYRVPGLARKKPWYQSSWPILSLLLGILLACAAIFLHVQEYPGDIFTFILASLALFAGLGGLLIQIRKDSDPEEDVEDSVIIPTRTIHREIEFQIDRGLLQKIAKAQGSLEARLREHGWEADWDTLRRFQTKVEQFEGKNQIREAFRESCRALRILTEAIQNQRSKEEVFKPLWEGKKPAKPT